MKIRAIQVRAVAAPMKLPLQTSIATVSVAPLLLLDLETDQGIVGRSYLFALARHHLPPLAKLVGAMAEMVKGDEVAPFDLERKLRARYALLGVHNMVLFAMAGIDMAAWDALGQSLNQPLARLLGAKPRPVLAYNSKGLGLLPEKELVSRVEREVERLVASKVREREMRETQSSYDASFAQFQSPAIEAVAIAFMLAAGINFGTHFIALRRLTLRPYLADPELRAYLLVIGATTLILIALAHQSLRSYRRPPDDSTTQVQPAPFPGGQ